MATLSAQDACLSNNDRVTVQKLCQLGLTGCDTKHTLEAAALGAAGLSTNALVALVRAAVPRVVDGEGVETRPKTFVASEVTVHASGKAEITLALGLAP